MARLRKPSPHDEPIILPSTTTKATRSSPRKTVRESPSKHSLRYISYDDDEPSFLVPKAPASSTPVRKQRVLRPVASNSKLLRRLSGESLASFAIPEKAEKLESRRLREECPGLGYSYSRSLVRSLARSPVKNPKVRQSIEVPVELEQTLWDNNEADQSLWCGDEVKLAFKDRKPKIAKAEELVLADEDDEDDDPIIDVKNRRRQLHAQGFERKDDGGKENDGPKFKQEPDSETELENVGPLQTDQLPFGKGHSTISSWAQEVVKLASSPEPPSFFMPPPPRARTASMARSSRPTSSSSCTGSAIMQYIPTPTKQRSPRKAPPVPRPSTPPVEPESPSKLVSPSKKNARIPTAALRPSLDAFWSADVVNSWNDKHSPSKPLFSPRKEKLLKQLVELAPLSDSDSDASFYSPTSSPRKKASTKKDVIDLTIDTPDVKQIRAQRKAFSDAKHALAESFLAELDSQITNGQIASMAAQTGGIKLIWSKTLKTTAGRANWRRESLRLRTGPLPADLRTEIRHHCSIELAEKVIDDEERLYNVLAHEYCHLTTFMLSEVRNNPHGKEFKVWAAQVSAAFAHKAVTVTTKHSYSIEYKYVWECVSCGYAFKRHSKSVDPARHSCGKCKGALVQTKPTPRGSAKSKDGRPREKGEYQVFVKAHFARVKSELHDQGLPTHMGKVMEAVAREYREMKAKSKEKQSEVDVQVDEVELALEGLNLGDA